ncbi:beta-propeller fold lactonase family protein [Variovorax rhizosphaerae]|uniref:beta-propeller fold lactonase family protein n=1 Tax=Variovorax rhizosphaerae TaxID=1836200 RepID=UPI003BF48F33
MVEPKGRFPYAASTTANSITAYSIGARGDLTRASSAPVSTGTAPWLLAIDPAGKFLYAADSQSSSLSEYAIDHTSGRLGATSCLDLESRTPIAPIRIDAIQQVRPRAHA